MADARTGGPETEVKPSGAPRRAEAADAYRLARETFLSDRRVDMQTLAADLGIGRATLHRWVQTRENVLDHVLGDLAADFFEQTRARAKGGPEQTITETVRIIVTDTSRFGPLRGFVRREPELALRLLLGERHRVRRYLLERVTEMVQELLPEEADRLGGFAEAVVAVGTALVWPTLVAGDEPSGERVAGITRALLAGARAGELPPDPSGD